jgi:hypothetical protein
MCRESLEVLVGWEEDDIGIRVEVKWVLAIAFESKVIDLEGSSSGFLAGVEYGGDFGKGLELREAGVVSH